MDTLRTLNNNNSPLRQQDRRNNDNYVFNSIRNDGFTDKGLTLTMNSLQQQQLMLAVQPHDMDQVYDEINQKNSSFGGRNSALIKPQG